MASVNSINYVDKNSIISISGIRDIRKVNDEMFNLRPVENNNGNLLFVGLYRFEVS